MCKKCRFDTQIITNLPTPPTPSPPLTNPGYITATGVAKGGTRVHALIGELKKKGERGGGGLIYPTTQNLALIIWHLMCKKFETQFFKNLY